MADDTFATKAAAFAWLGLNPGRVVRAHDSYHFAYDEERGLVRCVMSSDADNTVAECNDGAPYWAKTRAPFKALPPPPPKPATDAEIIAYFERQADDEDIRDRDALWRKAADILRTRRLP